MERIPYKAYLMGFFLRIACHDGGSLAQREAMKMAQYTIGYMRVP
jgi:hypothetical protein